jgi:hypothetical protein
MFHIINLLVYFKANLSGTESSVTPSRTSTALVAGGALVLTAVVETGAGGALVALGSKTASGQQREEGARAETFHREEGT